jgi:hypothetical protein
MLLSNQNLASFIYSDLIMKEENKTINMTQLMKKNTEGEKMINQLE